MSQVYHYQVEGPPVRLDMFVTRALATLSRSNVQKLIVEGHVTVNGRPVRAGVKLKPGDRVQVTIPPPTPGLLTPEATPLSILYEDQDLIVIDKPPGVSVHPAPGHPGNTILNAVLAHFPGLADMDDSPRPGVVHRLDKDTSGVLAIAKNKATYLDLVNQFKDRSVTKIYLALVKGKISPEKGVIEASIGRSPTNRQRMAVVSAGREARSEYRVLRYINGYSLLEVSPKTGRTHQIRVHLAAVGYPVIGDAAYGVKVPFLKRQFLHAYKLGLRLPSTGQYAEFTSELPPDLTAALEKISRGLL